MKIKPRQIALAGILLAVSAVLLNTPLGMIPVPTPARYATIMHIPIIIIGILEGPLLGGLAGLLFGCLAFLKVPEFGPVVHILPRPLIGILSALAYSGTMKLIKKPRLETLGISLAAVTGSVINTFGVVLLAVWLVPKLMPRVVAYSIIISAGIPEAVLAILFTVPLALAIKSRFPRYTRKIVNIKTGE
ncbi:MAG: ECF transporter S component [Vulcanimicrobiota bacterium]